VTFKKKIKLMKRYLLLKYEQGDWHGVADAAMDLRELIASSTIEPNKKSKRSDNHRGKNQPD